MAVSRALIEANKKYHALPSKEKEKSGALKKLYDEEIVKEKLLEKYGVTGKYSLSNKNETSAKKSQDGSLIESSSTTRAMYPALVSVVDAPMKVGDNVLNIWMESFQNHTSVATEQINAYSPYSNFINSSIIVVTVLIITILSTAITVQYKQKNKT